MNARKCRNALRCAIDSLESRTLFAAVTFPSANGLEFQTNGPARPPTIGDWYTSSTTASTDRAHYALIQVTADMLTAGGGTVSITVDDAESTVGSGPLDEVQGTPDPTRFRLLALDRTTVLGSTVVASGSPDGTAVPFNVTTPGTYYVESVTGAGPISGDNTPDLNDDDNAYTITVSQDGGLLGIYQGTFQQTTVGSRDLFFVVSPGTDSLFLRNFDLDGATITYTSPSGTTFSGTGSSDGLWNGPSPTLDTGGDTIPNLTSADVGTWTATITGGAVGNQTVFEPNDGDGNRIVILDTAPQRAGNFTVAQGSAAATTPSAQSVDYTFTVTNQFASADVINLTTAGTSSGFTAVLLNADGTPVTDTTGDSLADTGLLQPGQSKNYILRVTPTTAAPGDVDSSRVQAVSFLDQSIDSNNNTVRTSTFDTTVAAVQTIPAVANAVIDRGFLRSRNSTLTGEIAGGDPGPHIVTIDWGDGQTSRVNLGVGETAFSATHRFTGRSTPRATITVSDEDGNVSAPFEAITLSQAKVIQAFQDALGRNPTAEELARYSAKFDKCRSAHSLDRLAARLTKKLA